MRVCPSCGVENPDEARFCMACASPLVEAELLDPETLRRVMARDRGLEQLRAALDLLERKGVLVRLDGPSSPDRRGFELHLRGKGINGRE